MIKEWAAAASEMPHTGKQPGRKLVEMEKSVVQMNHLSRPHNRHSQLARRSFLVRGKTTNHTGWKSLNAEGTFPSDAGPAIRPPLSHSSPGTMLGLSWDLPLKTSCLRSQQ